MTIENKLGITNSAELAKEEERLSKLQAIKLFDSDDLANYRPENFLLWPLFMSIYFAISIALRDRFVM